MAISAMATRAGLMMAALAATAAFSVATAAASTHRRAGGAAPAAATAASQFDVVVYGATSGGVVAAVAAAKRGANVALLDPKQRIGGMSAGGLSATDVGDAAVIGGMALEFYKTNARHYNNASTGPQFGLEPHVALEIFQTMVNESGVDLFSNAAVESVAKDGTAIKSLTTTDGRVFAATVFVEADYEGDVMARAGVSYSVGRESNATYNESLAGYRRSNAGHEFSVAVSPIGDDGELLAMVDGWAAPAAVPGEGDRKVQSYNFRLCVTTDPDNLVPFAKPGGYDPTYWELARRYFNHPDITPRVNAPCGNVASYCGGSAAGKEKHDLNNGGPISTDFVGGSWGYPDANYSQRKVIFNAHKLYTQSFLWFMSTDPQLNASIRAKFQKYGLCKDEFQDTDHWPPQLYVRAARRLVGDEVFNQNTPSKTRVWGNASIGCGSYNFDSHTAERMACRSAAECAAGPKGAATNGPFAWNEGDVETGPGPYDIPLWVLLPKRAEATNLLVVASPSASHIGMSTLRMEPQFMIMGQSAGVIAAMSLDRVSRGGPIHDVDTAALHAALLEGGQIMGDNCTRSPPPAPPSPPAPHAAAYTVSGAGDSGSNGVYKFDPTQHRDEGTGFYTKSGNRQIYRIGGMWHLAQSSVAVYYRVQGDTPYPPLTGWVAVAGAKPAPTLSNATIARRH